MQKIFETFDLIVKVCGVCFSNDFPMIHTCLKIDFSIPVF